MTRVFCNGCYDLISPVHRALLNYAKSLGDKLFVAIDSDRRVAEMKGSDRPLFNQQERASHLNDLKAVDAVYLFDSEQQLIDTIELIKPDIMVIGSEYEGKRIVGAELIPKIIFFPKVEGISSTSIIEKIKNT